MKRHNTFVMCLKKGKHMKIKKAFGALAVLLALSVVGCGKPGGDKSGSKPKTQTTSALPSIKVTAEGSKTTLDVEGTVKLSADIEGVTWESATPTVATVDGEGLVTAVAAGSTKISASKDGYKAGSITITVNKPADPLWTPLPRTWTEGTPAQNSANKEYIPLTDETANKVGVKISIQNYEVAEGATASSTLSSDGKINPVNDHSAALAWKITAPKAGDYQLVMTGKCKTDAADYTLDQRSFAVTLNGEAVDVAATERIAVTPESAAFVAAPRMTLTGTAEDVVTVSCSDYRIQFDVASYLVFQEI